MPSFALVKDQPSEVIDFYDKSRRHRPKIKRWMVRAGPQLPDTSRAPPTGRRHLSRLQFNQPAPRPRWCCKPSRRRHGRRAFASSHPDRTLRREFRWSIVARDLSDTLDHGPQP